MDRISGQTSKKNLPSINLKLTIPTYFEALIANMIMKTPANFIFKVRTKKNVFNKFFHFMSINIDLGKQYLTQKL